MVERARHLIPESLIVDKQLFHKVVVDLDEKVHISGVTRRILLFRPVESPRPLTEIG